MKVADLKILLARYPDDFEVVLSSDGEGNNFSPLNDVVSGYYQRESEWSGQFCYEDDVAAIMDDPVKNNSICLWPTN